MMNYLDTSGQLTDFRNYESESVNFDLNSISDWFINNPYLIWNKELKMYNRTQGIDSGNFLKLIQSVKDGLRFLISDLQFNASLDPKDLYANQCLSFYVFEDTKEMNFQFSPWHSKIQLEMALHTAKYFNAVISMGSAGLVDENYLKNFE